MGQFTFDELKILAHPRSNVGVSVYMPFNDGTQGDVKNPAMLREILALANEALLSSGVKVGVAEKLLRPGYELAEKETYWRDKFETLAVFIFPNEFLAYKLPFAYEKTLIISRYPYLKPILRDFQADKNLYVLALAAGGSRLFRFNRYTYTDITPDGIEKSSKQFAEHFQIERETNYHMKRAGSGRTQEGIITHGHDNTEQLNKKRAEEYAHMVAKEVKKVAELDSLPLVLAGAKSGFLGPTFRAEYGGMGLVDDYIQVETMPLDMVKVQAGVRRIIENMEREEEKVSVEDVANLIGTGYEESDPDQIVKMAYEGRVATLFVNDEKDVFGVVNNFNDTYEARVTNNPEDEDLTNIAIINVWNKDGKVFFVPDEIVEGRPMMAALRY